MLELDVNDPAHLEAVAADLEERWGALDGVLHAIAFAPEDALGGGFLTAPAESAELAFRTSAFSLKALAAVLAPLLERAEPSGAIVGLDFDATVAWPVYDWMGVAKAALESINRYLARDLGRAGCAPTSSPPARIRTMAARSIPGFGDLADLWEQGSAAGLGPARPRAWSPTCACSCSRPWRGRSPARSCTWTAGTTHSAPRVRVHRPPPQLRQNPNRLRDLAAAADDLHGHVALHHRAQRLRADARRRCRRRRCRAPGRARMRRCASATKRRM